jgi:hypothetical protein
MKYATLDTNGLPTAFYADDIHIRIPINAIAITDEQWSECLNNQGVRQFINGALVPYTAPVTLEQAKATKLAEVTTAYNNAVYAIAKDVDRFELASWTKQEDEARAYIADNTIATPLLNGLVETRGLGEAVLALANKVIENADNYQKAYSAVLGTYQGKKKAITSATTVEEVQEIQVGG